MDPRLVVPIAVRAFSTVITVAIAVVVTASTGDSWQGKIVAALIIAGVIAFVEWYIVWAPAHIAWARRRLDVRAVMLGAWVQTEVQVKAWEDSSEQSNNFGVFIVNFQDGRYSVEGRAFDSHGKEYAKFWSSEETIFSEHGRQMSYIFNGELNDVAARSTDRSGIAWLKLSSDDSGTGKVVHVAAEDELRFKFRRVTSNWLSEFGLSGYSPESLDDVYTQDQFAADFSTNRQSTGLDD